MTRLHLHPESHLVSRIGWLRAAVLGANDGIVSTASLIVGVAAAAAASSDILIAGVAGLVAGAVGCRSLPIARSCQRASRLARRDLNLETVEGHPLDASPEEPSQIRLDREPANSDERRHIGHPPVPDGRT